MKKFNVILALILSHFTFLTAQYAIYSKSGSTVAIDEVIADVKNAHVVFFGEQHDDSLAHKAQLDVLSALHAAKSGKVVL